MTNINNIIKQQIMKKFAIMAMMALALGFTACDDIEDAPGKPQENPQLPIFSASSVAVTPSQEAQGVINLQSLAGATDPINLGTVVAQGLPEGYALELKLFMSKTNAFAQSVECPVAVVNGAITATVDDLQGAYYQITKDPAQGTVAIRYEAYAVATVGQGNQQVARIGGLDTYYGAQALTLVPFAAETEIQQQYFVNGAEMYHTAGVSVYDEPVFALKVNAGNNYQWSVATANNNVVYGVEDPTAMSGNLVVGGAKGEIAQAGAYVVIVNMEQLTYNVITAADVLYTPGNSNGWSGGSSQQLYTGNSIVFYGFAFLNGQYKYTTDPNWAGINYGAGATDGMLSNDGGAGNLPCDVEGLYWNVVNVASLTYTRYLVSGMTVAGTALTPSEDYLVWEGDVNLTGAFTIDVAGERPMQLGGNPGNVLPGGAAINGGTGMKHITLDLSTLPYAVYVD